MCTSKEMSFKVNYRNYREHRSKGHNLMAWMKIMEIDEHPITQN